MVTEVSLHCTAGRAVDIIIHTMESGVSHAAQNSDPSNTLQMSSLPISDPLRLPDPVELPDMA